jgi:hypothetical protein
VRQPDNPWPEWPKIYRLDYGQEEAKARFGGDPRIFLTTGEKFAGAELAQKRGGRRIDRIGHRVVLLLEPRQRLHPPGTAAHQAEAGDKGLRGLRRLGHPAE